MAQNLGYWQLEYKSVSVLIIHVFHTQIIKYTHLQGLQQSLTFLLKYNTKASEVEDSKLDTEVYHNFGD